MKISGCCTDGTAAMMWKSIGFNTLLKVVARVIHWYIQSQALSAKRLSKELHDVLNVCVKVVNLLKAKSFNSRLFSALCSDEKYKTLFLHTEREFTQEWVRIGRPVTAASDNIILEVSSLVEGDPHIAVLEIADAVGISTGTAHAIVHENIYNPEVLCSLGGE